MLIDRKSVAFRDRNKHILVTNITDNIALNQYMR